MTVTQLSKRRYITVKQPSWQEVTRHRLGKGANLKKLKKIKIKLCKVGIRKCNLPTKTPLWPTQCDAAENLRGNRICTPPHPIPPMPADFWAQLGPSLFRQFFMERFGFGRIRQSPSWQPSAIPSNSINHTLPTHNTSATLDWIIDMRYMFILSNFDSTIIRAIFTDSIYASIPKPSHHILIL